MKAAIIIAACLVAYIILVTFLVRWQEKQLRDQKNYPRTGKRRYSKAKESRNN